MRNYLDSADKIEAFPRLPTLRFKLWRDLISISGDLLPITDFVCVVVAAYLSLMIVTPFSTALADKPILFWASFDRNVLTLAALAPFVLFDKRFVSNAQYCSPGRVIRNFLGRFARFAALVAAISFAVGPSTGMPKSLFVAWLAICFGLTLISRGMIILQFRALASRGLLAEAVAIVGSGPVAETLKRRLQDSGRVRLVGLYDDMPSHSWNGQGVAPSSVDALVELGKASSIDWVVIAQPLIDETKLAELVHALKSLSVAIGVYSQEFGLVSMQEIACVGDDLPVRVVADRPIKHWNAILKVLLDGIVGGALLLFLSPLIVLIALAIKLESPGPAFFRQSRHAWNNDEFMVFKFRSMRWQPKEGGRLQQTRVNDDRITPLGRLLRKTSLDEIPQLFNVMRGEMSLVGPRPHAVDMRTQERLGHEIIATYAHRHRVKPGMTGWSQVKGYRGATETEEQLRQRIELDLYYVENWSLWFDVKILFLTVWIVLRGTNAH